ncbi:ATP-binding protein [Candidatus Magnetominusculus dajiuhuensis]|uniref:ATP-binding protein n=1 Tax=Candidatus Magnetominusculus dajiuhuensis TaxID=3137712 RepID=UPI003B42E99F
MAFREIAKFLACSNSIEEALDRVYDLCNKDAGAFKTLNVFVDRGFPTYCYTSGDKKVLMNIQIPWDSLVGECIRERKQVISCSPESLELDGKHTGAVVLHSMAKPLVCFNNTFGCMEFLTQEALQQHEIEMFGIIGDYFAPIIYLQEWYSIEKRIAHAIKNKAFIGILTLYDEDVDEQEKQSTLDESFKEISTLSEDTLKLMGIKCELHKRNVNDIIATVIEKIDKLAKLNNKNVKIIQELTPGLQVYCDEFSIREEVLFNIVKNIWEEWQNRNMEERIVEFRTYKEDNYATIEIKDNAGGMSEKVASRFALPFESSKGFGRGVGMNIVYQVIKQNNGEITFKTKEGEGTTFYIKLSMLEINRRVLSRYQTGNDTGNSKEVITLEFNLRKDNGYLVDLSMGGLLGVFKINPPYPQIASNVTVGLDFGNGNNVSGLTGLIARIEVIEQSMDDGYIKVAVRFHDKPEILKNERLMRILSVCSIPHRG